MQIDDDSGLIATCTKVGVKIYKPYGQDEGALKVGKRSSEDFTESLILMNNLVVAATYSTPTR